MWVNNKHISTEVCYIYSINNILYNNYKYGYVEVMGAEGEGGTFREGG